MTLKEEVIVWAKSLGKDETWVEELFLFEENFWTTKQVYEGIELPSGEWRALGGTHSIMEFKDLPMREIPAFFEKIKNVTILRIEKTLIEKLEHLPEVSFLEMSFNQIEKIENLPLDISRLDLSYNKIKKIENVPNDVRYLRLRDNRIEKIENLPPSVVELDVQGNRIEVIDELVPESLAYVYLEGNPLKEMKKGLLKSKQCPHWKDVPYLREHPEVWQ